MTTGEQGNSQDKPAKGGAFRRLSWRIVLDLEQSPESENQPSGKPQTHIGRVLHAINERRIVIEIIALLVAGCYAYLTHSLVVQQALVDRPVVLPHPVSPSEDGAEATVMNFGKTVALEVVVPGMVVYGTEGKEPPFDPRCRQKQPPQGLYMTTLAPDSPYPAADLWEPTPTEPFGKPDGRTRYAVGCIYYKGLDGTRYYTDICTELIRGEYIDCKFPDRDYVK